MLRKKNREEIARIREQARPAQRVARLGALARPPWRGRLGASSSSLRATPPVPEARCSVAEARPARHAG